MLYIYGRIFCTIRQRSRSHLGEISSASRCHRPPLWAHLATSNELTHDLPVAAMPSSSGGGDANCSSGGADIKEQWGGRLRRLARTQKKNKVSKTATNDETLFCHGNKTDVYESLTLLEIKHEQAAGCVVAIIGNDVSGGITHCTNVRVQVEYVVEEGDGTIGGEAVADESEQGVIANVNKCGGCGDVDGNQFSSERYGKSGGYRSSSSTVHSSGLISQKERKAARQLGVIMCAFMVCWLPYFIMFLVVAVCPTCTGDSLNNVTLWLGYINSTLNPVLYPLCNVKFRRAFARMMTRTCHLPCAQHQTYPLSKGKMSAATRPRY